jgi:alkyl sulfatase BDS1-like metallo-beta-lactamase superfamily hydrolase
MAPMTSNVYLVVTPGGNVVIDTAPARDAAEARDLLTAISHAPVKYIILTHGHADPIFGEAQIVRRLTCYRDAIQYVHDETVKGMDAGKDVYTLMQEIRLPASYGLSEAFGKVSWSVRGIYDGYAGWYDGNPTSMYELPASSVYPDLVTLAGGPDAIVQLALTKLAAGKPVETLHLTDVVLAYDARNAAALKARIKALESLRERSENVIEDGWLQYGIRKAQGNLTAN